MNDFSNDIAKAETKFFQLSSGISKFQVKLGLSTLAEWCENKNKQAVVERWLSEDRKPEIIVTNMTLLHYNIRHFYSNQCALLDMVSKYNPTLISLNELGTNVPEIIIKRLLFSYNVFSSKGTNAHGGVVLAVDKKLNSIPVNIGYLNIVAVQVMVKNQTYVIASIYSPPNETIPLEVMSSLYSVSKNVIILGDFNAKHPDWGCTSTNQKGRVLANWLDINGIYEVQNPGMKTSLRSDTTIDLVITSKTTTPSHCSTLPYTGSDHLPIMVELSDIIIRDGFYIMPKTYWQLYKVILTIVNPHIEKEKDECFRNNPDEWFVYFQQLLEAIKAKVTVYHQTEQKRPTLSPSLRLMLKHKHYLQNRYRHTKLEMDRIRLRSWNKLVHYKLKAFRQNSWMNFISKVASPNPKHFWNTIKCLNKKKSINFSAITEDRISHKTPTAIVECLQEHFSARFLAPTMNANNSTDVAASRVWETLSNSDQEDIDLVCENSDLKFTVEDLKLIIMKLKSKNSSGLDNVSNKMVKLLPYGYLKGIISAYNDLFRSAYWNKNWKQARTICLNKVENPAPTTNQLRPISLLPVFSKIYEKLFLLKFDKWLEDNDILPTQQSGSRPHQSTLTRVNHLVEQLSQSLTYNSFSMVVYVDFLQAFDMLWHHGFILKLYHLNCPYPYLFWIINYFKDRTTIIDYQGHLSKPISITRGAPQGSCFGPKAYIVNQFDLPFIFSRPQEVHLYVDDLAVCYAPSIHLKYANQQEEIKERINNDMLKLEEYSNNNHQPVNHKKTEFVVYHKSVQVPKIQIKYENQFVQQQKSFSYLGFQLDGKLSFLAMLNDQLIKLRKSFTILKYIHQAFPAFFVLKMRFFQTYTWPHLYNLAMLYCLLSNSNQERINSFYRRCLRMIFCSYRASTENLHASMKLPTLEERYKKCLQKRIKNIQLFEKEWLESVLSYKNMMLNVQQHYSQKPFIKNLPIGRPNKRITKLVQADPTTYFDKICQFTLSNQIN